MINSLKSFLLQELFPLIPPKRGPVVLTFHNISPAYYDWFNVITSFIADKYGFVDSLSSISVSDHKSSNPVLLTFDDGFRGNRYIAEKFLTPLGIQGIFFLISQFIGLSGRDAFHFAQKNIYPHRDILPTDGDPDALTWDDVQYLRDNGHTIGSHTLTHSSLANLPLAVQEHEITTSTMFLQDRLGIPIKTFAYPFGTPSSVDRSSLLIASSLFDIAFSNVRGGYFESPNKTFVFRQNITPGMPLWLIDHIIQGRLDSYHWKARLKSRKLCSSLPESPESC